jgi:hypothetical protein
MLPEESNTITRLVVSTADEPPLGFAAGTGDDDATAALVAPSFAPVWPPEETELEQAAKARRVIRTIGRA